MYTPVDCSHDFAHVRHRRKTARRIHIHVGGNGGGGGVVGNGGGGASKREINYTRTSSPSRYRLRFVCVPAQSAARRHPRKYATACVLRPCVCVCEWFCRWTPCAILCTGVVVPRRFLAPGTVTDGRQASERSFKVDINMSLITTARLTIVCLHVLRRHALQSITYIYRWNRCFLHSNSLPYGVRSIFNPLRYRCGKSNCDVRADALGWLDGDNGIRHRRRRQSYSRIGPVGIRR